MLFNQRDMKLKRKVRWESLTLLVLLSAFSSSNAHAITDTAVIPKGVRALIYRSVWASTDGSFDANGIRSGYDVNQTL